MAKSKRKKEVNLRNLVSELPKKDVADIWLKMKSIYDYSLIKDLEPNNFFDKFKTYRITLHQVKLYETAIKQKLSELVKLNTEQEKKTEQLLQLFDYPSDKIYNNDLEYYAFKIF